MEENIVLYQQGSEIAVSGSNFGYKGDDGNFIQITDLSNYTISIALILVGESKNKIIATASTLPDIKIDAEIYISEEDGSFACKFNKKITQSNLGRGFIEIKIWNNEGILLSEDKNINFEIKENLIGKRNDL